MVPSAMRRRMVFTDSEVSSAASARLMYAVARRSLIGSLRPQRPGAWPCAQAAGFGDGDVEPAAAVEAMPSGSGTASAPVAHGALRYADEGAELLEREEPVVVPFVGDLNGFHGCFLSGAVGLLCPDRACGRSPRGTSAGTVGPGGDLLGLKLPWGRHRFRTPCRLPTVGVRGVCAGHRRPPERPLVGCDVSGHGRQFCIRTSVAVRVVLVVTLLPRGSGGRCQ